MKILGIDPGTKRIGFGVIEQNGNNNPTFLDAGLLKISATEDADALVEAKEGMQSLIKKYQPDYASVEELYFSKNQKTAMAVSQARGVILLVCRELGIPVKEYAPTTIKANVTGHGGADKKAVAKMVRLILKEPELKVIDDASDALAAALVAAQEI